MGPLSVLRLDYISCVLTVVSTILIGKRYWGGWLLAGVNSVIICLIGIRTSQFGLIPANIFCILLYGLNIRNWRAEAAPETAGDRAPDPTLAMLAGPADAAQSPR